MRPDILIVGQGLAGSLLGWALERAGIDFAIADAGPERAASSVAAGLINPVTGRRLVKSWGVDMLLPQAAQMYREIGEELGVPVWHPLRVHRLFADNKERAAFAAKRGTGELAPYAYDGDEAGFWIELAARVDLRQLVSALRLHWEAQGRLREPADMAEAVRQHELVIDCRGLEGTRWEPFAFVPWAYSKGELLELAVAGLAPDVVINRRHWVAPFGTERAWVGATHEPGVVDPAPTASARATLEASARELLPQGFAVVGQRAGIRVNLPDKLPVVGRHPTQPNLGVLNGLGAKGALYAPWLAQQWVAHLQSGAAFAPEVAVTRFWRG